MIFIDNTSCKLSIVRMVTWQPVDEAPIAKVQVTMMLPLSSTTVVAAGWRPVVSIVEHIYTQSIIIVSYVARWI